MIIMLVLAIKEINLLDEYSQTVLIRDSPLKLDMPRFSTDSLRVFFIFSVSHFSTLFSYVHSPFLSLPFHSIFFFSANNGPEILMVYFFPQIRTVNRKRNWRGSAVLPKKKKCVPLGLEMVVSDSQAFISFFSVVTLFVEFIVLFHK